MWTVKDIYPSRTNPGMISVQYWNEEEEKNCKSKVVDYRPDKVTRDALACEIEFLDVASEAKQQLQPVCAELAAKFIPAPEAVEE